MHNVCFATKKCPHPFFAERFQRLVECCLIGRKEIIPNCGRACFIDHFKRPVGRLKPIDVDANFSSVFSNGTRQSRFNEFWIAHTFLRTPAYSSHHIRFNALITVWLQVRVLPHLISKANPSKAQNATFPITSQPVPRPCGRDARSNARERAPQPRDRRTVKESRPPGTRRRSIPKAPW